MEWMVKWVSTIKPAIQLPDLLVVACAVKNLAKVSMLISVINQ